MQSRRYSAIKLKSVYVFDFYNPACPCDYIKTIIFDFGTVCKRILMIRLKLKNGEYLA